MAALFRPLIAGFIGLLFFVAPVLAAPVFPELTGRVIDDAHILTPATQQLLEHTLEDYEHNTTNQVVVATIKSLDGYSIDAYSNELGRHWQIGQKDKNNGVLLLVAPNDKKVRLEVGYGLEPVLTDALSSQIVHGILIPAFASGKMESGIVDGTNAILDVLGGRQLAVQPVKSTNMPPLEAWLILLLILWFFVFSFRHPLIAAYIISNSTSRYGSSRMGGSSWGGGGFSGGGGSFGGGGASGRW